MKDVNDGVFSRYLRFYQRGSVAFTVVWLFAHISRRAIKFTAGSMISLLMADKRTQ